MESIELYERALTAFLTAQPEAVVDRIANFETGIMTKCKYLPSVADYANAAKEVIEQIKQEFLDEYFRNRQKRPWEIEHELQAEAKIIDYAKRAEHVSKLRNSQG